MALEVLVVDDEADIRELVSGVLEDEGFTVRSAADSTAALEAIEERRPSLVLLDVWLQGSRLDGLQILQEVKRRCYRLHRKALRGGAIAAPCQPRDGDRSTSS